MGRNEHLRNRVVRYAAVAVLAIGSALALWACGGSNASAPGENAGGDLDRPRVLTSFTVLADMVENVGGERIEVISITKPGSEIHGYEPTPSDLRNAADADLVLWNGLELERWFEQFIDRAGSDHAILTEGVDVIPIAGTSEYAGKPNPHAWMSLDNAGIYLENTARALSDLDPDGEATYRVNAERYLAEIEEIAEWAARKVESIPDSNRLLVTCEGAFSYLARDLGLREAYIWPVNAEREGTPQQIGATVEAVRDSGVPSVFCESTVDTRPMEQVASESGSELAGTLYVDSLSQDDGPVPTYLDLLRHDVETIVTGLERQRG